MNLDQLRTLAAQSFDLENFSITVGYHTETDQMALTIRDEKSADKNTYALLFDEFSTEEQVKRMLLHAAQSLKPNPSPAED